MCTVQRINNRHNTVIKRRSGESRNWWYGERGDPSFFPSLSSLAPLNPARESWGVRKLPLPAQFRRFYAFWVKKIASGCNNLPSTVSGWQYFARAKNCRGMHPVIPLWTATGQMWNDLANIRRLFLSYIIAFSCTKGKGILAKKLLPTIAQVLFWGTQPNVDFEKASGQPLQTVVVVLSLSTLFYLNLHNYYPNAWQLMLYSNCVVCSCRLDKFIAMNRQFHGAYMWQNNHCKTT